MPAAEPADSVYVALEVVSTALRLDSAVLRAALDAIIAIDAHGTVIEFNPAAERMFGYAREVAVGADMADLIIPPESRAAHRRGLARLLDGGESAMLDRRIELEAQHADGSRFPAELAVTRMPGAPGGESAIYTGFLRDLSDHRRAEQERAQRLERQALVVGLSQTALRGIDPTDLVTAGLSTLAEGLGVSRGTAVVAEDDTHLRREAAIGLDPLFGHGEPVGDAYSVMLKRTAEAGGALWITGDAVPESGLPVAEDMRCLLAVAIQASLGGVAGLFIVAAPRQEALGPEDEGFARAIANVVGTALARWRADAEIARLGLHDPLTGLANRPLFQNRVEQALESARRGQGEAAVLFVDLDGFSNLNDGYGHRTGEEVLVGASARLDGVAPVESSVGRLGGDDFGVLLPGITTEADALALAERMQAALNEPMLVGGRELVLTASIGVVMTEHGRGSAADLLRAASAAAARARARGGARAELATQGMRRRLAHLAEIEQGMRRALTDGELRLHFQPIIDLREGEMVGVEAFVRWQHPDHGLLSPAQFLDATEAVGLAVPLGAEVLSLACRALAEWTAELGAERAPAVHVNISARQFAAPGLAAAVARALQSTGVAPHKLVLEIAETMVTGEADHALAQLGDLRALGVRILLDRFGTGYSSLAAIRQLPFHALKVDSSFLTELGAGSRDVRLIEAMIGLGHSLGLEMIATRVESEEQLRLLRSLGLDCAQGELFAAPLSVDASLELARQSNPWVAVLEATKPPEVPDAEAPGSGGPAGAAAAHGGEALPTTVGTLTLGQAAKALQISTTTARRWADDGRLRSTRTSGGHRRFPMTEIRRIIAARGAPAVTPTVAPQRPLPSLAGLLQGHGRGLADIAWRGLYGELRGGYFADPDCTAATDRWLAAVSSAAATGNFEMLHEATAKLMRDAERSGASLLERHLALERFAETTARALARRAAPHDDVVGVRRLFAHLEQRQLADAG